MLQAVFRAWFAPVRTLRARQLPQFVGTPSAIDAGGSLSYLEPCRQFGHRAEERWLSGRKRRFAKPLYWLKPVPRVRIPPSPPIAEIPTEC